MPKRGCKDSGLGGTVGFPLRNSTSSPAQPGFVEEVASDLRAYKESIRVAVRDSLGFQLEGLV